MSVSSQTRGSTVEQLVFCEHRIAELEAERDALEEDRERLEWMLGDGYVMYDAERGYRWVQNDSPQKRLYPWSKTKRGAIDEAMNEND